MSDVIAVSGSLWTGSYNTALLRTAAGLAPDGCEVHLESIRGIPPYDADLEGHANRPAVG